MNIFYLKWLWEGMKTPNTKLRNNVCAYLLFEMALGRHENTKFCTRNGESALAGVGRNNICEYLLFEMALGRHENTKFCTRNWGICTGMNICEYLLFEMALARHENTKFCTRNWRICTGRGGQE